MCVGTLSTHTTAYGTKVNTHPPQTNPIRSLELKRHKLREMDVDGLWSRRPQSASEWGPRQAKDTKMQKS